MVAHDSVAGGWGRRLFQELHSRLDEQRRQIIERDREIRDLRHRLRRVSQTAAVSDFGKKYEPYFLHMSSIRSDRTSQTALPIKCVSSMTINIDGTAQIDDEWVFKQLGSPPNGDERLGVPFEYRVPDEADNSYRVEINERPGSETRKSQVDEDQLIIEKVSAGIGDYWVLTRQGSVRLRVCRARNTNKGRRYFSFCKAFLYAAAGTEVSVSLPAGAVVDKARILLPKQTALPNEERMRLAENVDVSSSGSWPKVSYIKTAEDVLLLGKDYALQNGPWPPWPTVNVRFSLPETDVSGEFVELDHTRIAECGGPQCPQG